MFEQFTQDNLLTLALEKGKELNVSVIEGSLCYNAAALMSVMLEDMADEAERLYVNSHPDTCDREHLIDFAKRRGLFPYAATASKVKASCNIELPVGTVMSGDTLNYIVTEYIKQDSETSLHYMLLQCETVGEAGNSYIGALYPIEHIEGFSEAQITEITAEGSEEEETEAFRQRYFDVIDVLPMAGNTAYYRKYVKEAVADVGYVRVTYTAPYVYITVTDSDGSAASSEVLSAVEKAMGTKGDGYAPINHQVKAQSATIKLYPIALTLSVDEDAVTEDVEAEIRKNLEKYFEELNEGFETGETRIIRLSMLINAAVTVKGVTDCTVAKISGTASNVTVPLNTIAKVGSITCSY